MTSVDISPPTIFDYLDLQSITFTRLTFRATTAWWAIIQRYMSITHMEGVISGNILFTNIEISGLLGNFNRYTRSPHIRLEYE